MTDASFAHHLVGLVLDGRYRLDAVLGVGGMGAVFRAQHLAMDRRVAVKLLRPHLTADAVARQRFAREARATLKVDSPHAVKALDFGVTPDGDYYMVLEYLDGRTVQRELDVDGPFAPARVLHIARQALHALAAAHRSGLIHRDIKPENLLLLRVGDDPDHAKLLDFGVAKLMEGAATSARSRLALTQAGVVFGTPELMSPEQACGHPLDGRSDLYSLAATMFTMLTGTFLFTGSTPLEWLTHHVRTPPPRLATVEPALAAYPALDALLQRCLAKQRDQRPRSAEELDHLLAELEPVVQGVGGLPRARATTPAVAASKASAYVEALPPDLIPPGLPLPAAIAWRAPAGLTAPAPTADHLGARPGRRGLMLALGGFVVLGVIASAIVIAARKSGTRGDPAPRAAAAARAPAAPVPAPPPSDAVVAPAAVPPAPAAATDAALPPSARPAASPRAAAAIRRAPDPSAATARAHLERAEAAMRAGNRLRQLAEADLALAADPRSARARYLLADALIETGDLDRGCAYLRSLGGDRRARARAHAARCPTD